MSENINVTNPEQESKFSIVTVPEELREQVVSFIEQLRGEEAEVGGYMMAASLRSFFGTKCVLYGSGANGTDIQCGD